MQQSRAALPADRPAGRPSRVPSKGILCEQPHGNNLQRATQSCALLQPCRPGFPLRSVRGGNRRRVAGRSFNNISFFSIIFLDTDEPAPYIGLVNARSAPAAAGRRPPKTSKRRNRRGTVRDRSVFPALRPAAAGWPSSAPPYAPLGLTAGPHTVPPSGSTLRFRRAVLPPILPGGAVTSVERRSRPAGNL